MDNLSKMCTLYSQESRAWLGLSISRPRQCCRSWTSEFLSGCLLSSSRCPCGLETSVCVILKHLARWSWQIWLSDLEKNLCCLETYVWVILKYLVAESCNKWLCCSKYLTVLSWIIWWWCLETTSCGILKHFNLWMSNIWLWYLVTYDCNGMKICL